VELFVDAILFDLGKMGKMRIEIQPKNALSFIARISIALLTMLFWGLPFSSAVNSFVRFGAVIDMHPSVVMAAPMVTQIVTVTNSTDDVNGDTSNILDLIASPGADGISLREALIASNNTSGVKTIEFAPALAGASIFILAANDAWPTLTSGDLTIQGDINGDGIPDITLDGSQGLPNSPTANCIHIWSDNNTITDLKIQNFSGSAIAFGVPNFYNGTAFTMAGNNVLNNTIVGSTIGIGPFGFISMNDSTRVSNLTWRDMTIAGNHLTSTTDQVGGIALIAAGVTANHNRILNVSITGNMLSGYGVGIMAIAADTNSVWHGGPPSPITYADDNLIQGITIANNQIDNIVYKGIEVGAGNMGNRGNQVKDVVIHDNVVKSRASVFAVGITIFAASDGGTADRTESGNIVANLNVVHNQIQDMNLGIRVVAADTNYTDVSPGFTANQLTTITIANNTVMSSQQDGILVKGGSSVADFKATDNLINGLVIQGNQVLTGTQPWAKGIEINGGLAQGLCLGCVASNQISGVQVMDNQVIGFDYGLSVIGGSGEGAVSNIVAGSQHGNNLIGNTHPYQFIDNLVGAINNSIGDGWLYKLFLPMLQN
jgi:hypothetical protein